MRKLLLLTILAALLPLGACKTSEANYRAAYEKAMAGRDSTEALENTIYGRERRNVGTYRTVTASGDTLDLRRQLVKITDGGGGIRENLRRYCIVVGQFKQKFNAVSMRERLVDQSLCPGAFVVETAEPYYYVVATSAATLPEAAAALDALRTNPPIAMRPPLPFILEATAR